MRSLFAMLLRRHGKLDRRSGPPKLCVVFFLRDNHTPPPSPSPGGNHNQQVSPPVLHALLRDFIGDALTDGGRGGTNTHLDVQVVNLGGRVCVSGLGGFSGSLLLIHSHSLFLFRRICDGSAALICSHLGASLTRSVPDASPLSAAAAAAAHPKLFGAPPSAPFHLFS